MVVVWWHVELLWISEDAEARTGDNQSVHRLRRRLNSYARVLQRFEI
jgi:hypothetical protein